MHCATQFCNSVLERTLQGPGAIRRSGGHLHCYICRRCRQKALPQVGRLSHVSALLCFLPVGLARCEDQLTLGPAYADRALQASAVPWSTLPLELVQKILMEVYSDDVAGLSLQSVQVVPLQACCSCLLLSDGKSNSGCVSRHTSDVSAKLRLQAVQLDCEPGKLLAGRCYLCCLCSMHVGPWVQKPQLGGSNSVITVAVAGQSIAVLPLPFVYLHYLMTAQVCPLMQILTMLRPWLR